MKIKGISSRAVACALFGAAVVAVSAVGQAAVVPPTTPTRAENQPAFTAAEKSYIEQMQGVIASSKAKGALDSSSMNKVFAASYRANVSPQATGKMVSDLVRAYPDSVGDISSSALRSANGAPSQELVWHVMNSAVMSSPRPFATVLPVRDAVMRTIDLNKAGGMNGYVQYATSRIASATPDNPMNKTGLGAVQIGTEREQQGLAIKALRAGQSGHSVLFHDADVGINPFFRLPQPVSAPGGSTAQ